MEPIKHYDVTAELIEDVHGRLISLEQSDGMNDPACIYLNPWQLKAIADQFDLVAADEVSAKTIATLQRRLLVLNDRIAHLRHYLVNNSDHEHADLSYEVAYSGATADIASEFCHDLDEPGNPCKSCTPATVAVPGNGPASSKQASIDF